jgi:hypothetical protein
MRLRGSECRCINQQGTESPARTFFRRARGPAKAAVFGRDATAGSQKERGRFFNSQTRSAASISAFARINLPRPWAVLCFKLVPLFGFSGAKIASSDRSLLRLSSDGWPASLLSSSVEFSCMEVKFYATSVKCKYVCVLPRVIGCGAAGGLQHRPGTA